MRHDSNSHNPLGGRPARHSSRAGQGMSLLLCRDRTTSRLELLTRPRRELVRGHVEFDAVHVTTAEDLDLFALLGQAARRQLGRTDSSALRERRSDIAHIDCLVLHPRRVLETTQFRQPHVQWQLTALETSRNILPRTGALHAAPGSLALGGFAAADPLLVGLRTRSGTLVVNLDSHLITPPRLSRGNVPCGRGPEHPECPRARPTAGSYAVPAFAGYYGDSDLCRSCSSPG